MSIMKPPERRHVSATDAAVGVVIDNAADKQGVDASSEASSDAAVGELDGALGESEDYDGDAEDGE